MDSIKVKATRAGAFPVGAIVTRNGLDRHRVIDVNDAGDLIEVECVVAAEPFAVGDREWNLPRRYERATLEITPTGSSPSQAR